MFEVGALIRPRQFTRRFVVHVSVGADVDSRVQLVLGDVVDLVAPIPACVCVVDVGISLARLLVGRSATTIAKVHNDLKILSFRFL